jgi:hypothetical protein
VNLIELTDDQVTGLFPVQGWRMKCRLRDDLPKKERVHKFVLRGCEQRNSGTDLGYIYGWVFACVRCGHDRFKKDLP